MTKQPICKVRRDWLLHKTLSPKREPRQHQPNPSESTMFASRLGNITRARCLPVTRCASSSSRSFAAGSRPLYLRSLPERVASLQSRALHSSRRFMVTKALQNSSQVQAKRYHGSGSDVLQSAFPKKTFIALVVLSVALYLVPDVPEMDWADYAMNSFESDDPGDSPLHFYRSKEELEHYLQHHIPDVSQPLKDPGVVQFFSEQFERLAGGWRMTENDAVQENIPVTHGCRFKSNDPCEDYFAFGTSFGPGSQPWNYWSIMDGHAGRQSPRARARHASRVRKCRRPAPGIRG